MKANHNFLLWFQSGFCSLLLTLFTGCSRERPLEIGEISVRPGPTVPIGGKVQISASTRGTIPEGTTFRFWPQERCEPPEYHEVLTTFRAPMETGRVVVRIEAVRGGKVLATRACDFAIIIPDQTPGPLAPSVPTRAATPTPESVAVRPDFFIQANGFIPSGRMGDAEWPDRRYVGYDAASTNHPHSPPYCQKWSYTNGAGWAAVAWQYPANNFGEKPGLNLTNRGFTKVTWWARGGHGGEALEFFSGGVTDPAKPHQSSFAEVREAKILTTDWKEYSLGLGGKDLSSVICGFGWAAQGSAQPITFYLDDIKFE